MHFPPNSIQPRHDKVNNPQHITVTYLKYPLSLYATCQRIQYRKNVITDIYKKFLIYTMLKIAFSSKVALNLLATHSF